MLDLKIGFSPSISDSSIFISKCPPESPTWVRMILDLVTQKRRTTKQLKNKGIVRTGLAISRTSYHSSYAGEKKTNGVLIHGEDFLPRSFSTRNYNAIAFTGLL